MRITVNGKHSEVPVGRECEPSVWNRHVGREIGTKSDVRALNGYLDTLQTKIMNAHQLLIGAGECITSDRLRDQFIGRTEKSYCVIELFSEHNVFTSVLKFSLILFLSAISLKASVASFNAVTKSPGRK